MAPLIQDTCNNEECFACVFIGYLSDRHDVNDIVKMKTEESWWPLFGCLNLKWNRVYGENVNVQ
jgi:hypothetical protein